MVDAKEHEEEENVYDGKPEDLPKEVDGKQDDLEDHNDSA